MRVSTLLGLVVGVVLLSTPAFAVPPMPLGIPDPGAWAWASAPPRPEPWTAATPGYYYVDSATGTDSNNAYGWPEKPRATIPLTLPAGSVVEVHGTYAKTHSGQGQEIKSQGSSTQQVFIRGQDAQHIPTLTGKMAVYGSYLTLENLKYALDAKYTNKADRSLFIGPVSTVTNADHIMVRENEFTGTIYAGAVAIKTQSSYVPGESSDVVFYHDHIHHNGGQDPAIISDQDMHGIMINGRTHRVWVLDSELDHNAGDGVQINAGSSNNDKVTHIYIGRNNSHHNKQYGFWVKEAQDVIISENTIHDLIDSNSSMGACFGVHYSTNRTWFLFNNCYATERGVRNSTEQDADHLMHASERYLIGNLMHDIHRVTRNPDDSIPVGAPDNPNSESFFQSQCDGGPATWHIVNNTIYNVDGGIYCVNGVPPELASTFIIKNNLWGKLDRTKGVQINIVDPDITAHSTVSNEIYMDNGGVPGFRWGDATTRTLSGFMTTYPAQCVGCKIADPQFPDPSNQDTQWQPANVERDVLGAMQSTYVTWQNPSSQNYRIQAGSPAVDAGAAAEEFATFKSLYGIDIAQDLDHNPRVAGPAMDVGAYEATTSGGGDGGGTTGCSTDGRISVTWKPVEGVESYQVETSIDTGQSWQLAATVDAPPASIEVAQDTLVLIRVGSVKEGQTTWNTSKGSWYSCPWEREPGEISVDGE